MKIKSSTTNENLYFSFYFLEFFSYKEKKYKIIGLEVLHHKELFSSHGYKKTFKLTLSKRNN